MNDLRRHEELNEIFYKYRSPLSKFMMAEDLYRFVTNEQKDKDITQEDCAKIIT